MPRVLAIDIEFGSPPAFGAVFEFGPVTDEGIDARRPANHRFVAKLHVATHFVHIERDRKHPRVLNSDMQGLFDETLNLGAGSRRAFAVCGRQCDQEWKVPSAITKNDLFLLTTSDPP